MNAILHSHKICCFAAPYRRAFLTGGNVSPMSLFIDAGQGEDGAFHLARFLSKSSDVSLLLSDPLSALFFWVSPRQMHWSSIEALPEDLFADTPLLENLDVSSAKLTSLPAGVFAPLISLQIL